MTAVIDLIAIAVIGGLSYACCVWLSQPPRDVSDVDDGPYARSWRALEGRRR